MRGITVAGCEERTIASPEGGEIIAKRLNRTLVLSGCLLYNIHVDISQSIDHPDDDRAWKPHVEHTDTDSHQMNIKETRYFASAE